MTRQALDAVELAGRIRWLYHRVADYPQGDFHFPIGRPVAQRLGYPAEALDQLPAGAVESFAGVGFHLDLATVAPGGAMQLDDYRRAASDAGLRIEQERDNDYRFLSDGANEATRQWGVRSISLLARCEGW